MYLLYLLFPEMQVADRILFISEPWLNDIINGKKTVSGRAGTPARFSPWIGEVAKFCNSTHTVYVKVVDVRHYDDLPSYLTAEGWKKVAPHLKSYDEVRNAYSAFYKGGEAEIKSRGGFCGIVVEKMIVISKK